MAKHNYSAFDLPELGDTISAVMGKYYNQLIQVFGEIETPLMAAYQEAAEPMAYEVMDFVSMGNHYRSGDTLASFNPGTMFVEDDWYVFKFGFDMSKGGFPALILEYGDSGSPKRMPNKPYFFLYWGVKNHGGKFGYEIDKKVIDVLNDMRRKLGV